MKKFLAIVSVLLLISCNDSNQKKKVEKKVEKEKKVEISDQDLESAVIYEANIRQYSKEGTFNEFTKDIPKLKKLGVKIIWLMPIYPISSTKSKGSLGSYYAITDYTKANPEFGTLQDVKNLVKEAHKYNMYVVLDWVANHTGWDHIWLKENPEYYTKNDKGEITHTVGTDWTDVADLNYDNKEMRAEMLKAMKYWLTEGDVDGFRCDVAGMVPNDFWNHTIAELRKVKPIFMLAEGWEPELLENGFDMAYAWDTHHKMNDMAQGKATVKDWNKRMKQIDSLYKKGDILMNFVTNHDENSWNGTIKERMGEASELFTALTYIAPGMPLIYSGQEYGLNHRLKFFEKDEIPRVKGKEWELLEKLGKLKNENTALHGGKNAAAYQSINVQNEKIVAFKREKDGKSILFIGNISDKPQTPKKMVKGEFKDYIKGVKVTIADEFTLQPWEYKILIK